VTNNRIQRDVTWNLVSFAILGVSGILINVLVGRFYGAAVLGVFNLAFSFYITISQFSVLGLQFSVLRYISEYFDRPIVSNAIISSAIILTVVNSTASLLVFALASEFLLPLFNSDQLPTALWSIFPGVWAFAINKVLINIVNGHRHMRAYACIQAGRYLLIMVGIVVATRVPLNGARLTLCVSIAEIILLVILVGYLFFGIRWRPVIPARAWLSTQFLFGAKSFLGGAMSELNTRIDVLMLGMFTSELQVGVYSMAAMIAEGIGQLAVVVRNVINPIIGKSISDGEILRLGVFLRKCRTRFYFFMGGVLAATIAAYPFFIGHFFSAEFKESHLVFVVFCSGLAMAAGYLPMEMIFIQAGKPVTHTIFKVSVFATNIILNISLIPAFGIYGASAATASVNVISAIIIRYGARQKLGLRI